MAELQTPRQIVKALVRGQSPPRPLLLPVVFSLASRLENLPLRDFLTNPTKIVNALRQVRTALRVDGLMCYWDPFLEVEAIAGSAGWKTDSKMPAAEDSAAIDALRNAVEAAGGISTMGRVPVALEVLRRLKVVLNDETALMVRVTGPYALASQLTGAPKPSRDLLLAAADITLSLIDAYLQAGADVVFLVESAAPLESSIKPEDWRAVLDPLFNAIRFFEALPVLFFEEELSAQKLSRILGNCGECAVCAELHAEKVQGWQGVARWLGITM